MPLKQFQISNKGVIRHAECDSMPSVMIIAGPNGVGKSTLLEILKKNIPSLRESGIKIEATGTPLYVPPHRIPVSFNLHRLYSVITSRKFREMLAADVFPGLPSYLGGLPSYLASGSGRSRNQPDFSPSDIKRRLAEIDVEFNRVLRIVYDKKGSEVPKNILPSDIYKPFKDFVERLLHLRFDCVKLEGDYHKAYFINRLGARVEWDELSSGEKDIIATLFPFIEKQIENELARAKDEDLPNEDLIVLMDGPEQYLHPSLQRSFLRYTREQVVEAEKRKEKIQFIITTHSPTLVNEAEFEELFVMQFPDQVADKNQIVEISTDKEKFGIIRDFLGDITPLATGKPILFIEGIDDENILRLLIPDIEKNFTLFPLKGRPKVEDFISTIEKVIPELRERGFVINFILDKHYHEVKDKFDMIHTWTVTCIENFLLLDEEVIYEALKALFGPANLEERGIKSKENIKELIFEIIKDPLLVDKECEKRLARELHFTYNLRMPPTEDVEQEAQSDIKKRIERIRKELEETREELRQLVQDFERARREFDGKLILGELAKRFTIEKRKLSYLIADKLRSSNKIPSEIIDLLNRIRKIEQHSSL